MNKKMLQVNLFTVLLLCLTVSGFVTAHELVPGDPGGGGPGGGPDVDALYIDILRPTTTIISADVELAIKTTDGYSGVKTVKAYIDNVLKQTDTFSPTAGERFTYFFWQVLYTGSSNYLYGIGSTHTLKVVATDAAGNSHTITQNYIIGYTEEVQHYVHLNAYMVNGTITNFDNPIAYTIIETDTFVLVMQVTAQWILAGPNLLTENR